MLAVGVRLLSNSCTNFHDCIESIRNDRPDLLFVQKQFSERQTTFEALFY